MSGLLTEIRTLTRRSGNHDGVALAATIDPVFTIGPKVHGGSLQMVAVGAARAAFAELARASVATGESGLMPVAIASDYLSAPDPGVVDIDVTVRKHGRTVAVLAVDIGQRGRTMVSSTVTLAYAGTGEPGHRAPTGVDDVPVAPPADGVSVDEAPMRDIVHFGPALDMVLDPLTFPVMRGQTGPARIVGWARPKGAEPESRLRRAGGRRVTTGGDESRYVRMGADGAADDISAPASGAGLAAVRVVERAGGARDVRGGSPRGGLDGCGGRPVAPAGAAPEAVAFARTPAPSRALSPRSVLPGSVAVSSAPQTQCTPEERQTSVPTYRDHRWRKDR